MVSCQKVPTRHAYAWQIGPFWQDTLDILLDVPLTFVNIFDAFTYQFESLIHVGIAE